MTTTVSVSNTDDVIDSRDVIARLEEIEAQDSESSDPLDEATYAERKALQELAEQGQDYSPDWQYGSQLIRDSYFKYYAMELAEDIGVLPDEYTWPISCIDWDQAARELQMDYSSVEFDGVTYWVR